MKKNYVVLITIIVSILISLNFLLKPSQLTYINSSTITGLAIMRQMATETMSYEDAIVNHKSTLVEFYADWCTTCQSMSPTVKSLKDKYTGEINFVMVNIDNPNNQILIEEYQVAGVPQWNILNSQGKSEQKLIGKLPKSVLETSLLEVKG